MTWAVVGPAGEGEYWPNGRFDPWKERARKYYETEMPDIEKEKLGIVDELSFYEISRKYTNDMGWLDEFECPDEYQTFSTVKNLASMINTNNRLYLVDVALKDIIDGMEPGKHQFWPIKITMRNGKEYPDQYYGMVVHTHLDSFLPEKSDEKSFRLGRPFYRTMSLDKKTFAGLAMSRDIIGDAHIWQEIKFAATPRFFISDELKSEIDQGGLRLPKHLQLKDI